MTKKITSIHDFLEQTKDMTPAQAGKEFYWLTEKEIKEILSQKTEKKNEDANPKDLGPVKGKESNEKITSVLPWAVKKQEKDATDYFTKSNETNHLQVISEVQKLRDKKMITYKDTGNGTYEVHFNLPWSKMKRYMPPDTSIADSSYKYDFWDDTKITNQETKKSKLRSDEWKKHLEEKEKKEHKKLLTKEEILILWKELCPTGTEEEQILAIMIATGFYGYMWLSDKISEYQLAVICYRESDDRSFFKMTIDDSHCSIIYTSTL